MRILYFLLLLALSHYGSESYSFLLAEELGGVNYDWQLAGPPGGSEYNFSVVPALPTVYLLHELKVPGPFKEKTQAKNKTPVYKSLAARMQ
jgi:hypothetical protein